MVSSNGYSSLPLPHHPQHRLFGGQGLHFIGRHPAQVVGFLADGEVGLAGGAKDIADIVVEMLGLVLACGDRMDVEVEDAAA